ANALTITGATSTISGTVTLDPTGLSTPSTINLIGAPTLANSGNVTISEVITGGSLTKSGAGTLVLGGASTYTGSTTINDGTTIINSIADPGISSALGAPSGTDATIVFGSSNPTLQYTGTGHSSSRAISLASASTISAS